MAARITHSHEIDFRYTALKGSRAGLDGVVSRYVFNYPSHAGRVTWQAAFPRDFVGRIQVGVTKRLQREPYAVVDLYLARAGRRLRPFLQLTNLTNVSYEEILHVPMPGRGITGGIELVIFGPFN